MLAFIIILMTGLSGYVGLSMLTPLIAVLGLMSVTLTEHYGLVRNAVAQGQAVAIETLLRSTANALVACVGCYGFGRGVRIISGL